MKGSQYSLFPIQFVPDTVSSRYNLFPIQFVPIQFVPIQIVPIQFVPIQFVHEPFVTVSWPPKTYICTWSTTVFVPSSVLGPPTPSPPLPPKPPRNQRGRGHTRLQVSGEGVQIGRLERTPSTLSTLWF
jgi:hypothetical protein